LVSQLSCHSELARNLLLSLSIRHEEENVPDYWVYIMSSRSRTVYTGVTNDLERRVYEHKHGLVPGVTSKYRITRLVYFEQTSSIRSAIEREKQIKGWRRSKKVALIESANPTWEDLSEGWFEKAGPSLRSG